jgi:hypothetical protein
MASAYTDAILFGHVRLTLIPVLTLIVFLCSLVLSVSRA